MVQGQASEVHQGDPLGSDDEDMKLNEYGRFVKQRISHQVTTPAPPLYRVFRTEFSKRFHSSALIFRFEGSTGNGDVWRCQSFSKQSDERTSFYLCYLDVTFNLVIEMVCYLAGKKFHQTFFLFFFGVLLVFLCFSWVLLNVYLVLPGFEDVMDHQTGGLVQFSFLKTSLERFYQFFRGIYWFLPSFT